MSNLFLAGKQRRCFQNGHLLPVKTHSSVLLPWWEEEVEEGEFRGPCIWVF